MKLKEVLSFQNSFSTIASEIFEHVIQTPILGPRLIHYTNLRLELGLLYPSQFKFQVRPSRSV